MGQCNTKLIKKSQTKSVQTPHYSKQATSNLNEETHKFKLSISNIKGKQISLKACAVRLILDNKVKFQSEFSQDDRNPRWKQHGEFEYESQMHQLKTNIIQLQIINQNSKVLKEFKLNLYEVSTGPLHYSLNLYDKVSKIKGRISFDLKMNQQIKIQILTQRLSAQLTENLKEEAYNFSFKILSHQEEFQSDHSESFLNPQMMKEYNVKFDDSLQSKETSVFNQSSKFIKFKNDEEEDFDQRINEGQILTHQVQQKINNKNFNEVINISKQNIDYDEEMKKQSEQQLLCLQKQKSKLQQEIKYKSSGSLIIQKDKQIQFMEQQKQLKRELNWSENSKKQLPYLQVEINSHEIPQLTIQFIIWGNKIVENIENSDDDERKSFKKQFIPKTSSNKSDNFGFKYIDQKFIGECFISLNKIYREDFHAYEIDDQVDYIQTLKEKHISENLWRHGIQIGTLKADLLINNAPFIKQKICGVMTDDGYKKTTNLYLKKADNNLKINLPQEIKSIQLAKNNLVDLIVQLYEKNNQKEQSLKSQQLQLNAQQTVEQLLTLSKKTNLESSMSFLYRTNEEMFKAQEIFLELAKHLLENCDEVDESLKDQYYECLRLIVNRGEFDLNHMGFDDSFNYLLRKGSNINIQGQQSSNENIKTLQQKIKVAFLYQNLLYNCLKKVLAKLNQKSQNQNEKKFTENFLAIAYFRIPEFRQQILECLKQSMMYGISQVPEWRGAEWNLETNDNETKNKYFLQLFDWESDFYRYLKYTDEERCNRHLQNLFDIISNESWQKKVISRSGVFFLILSAWADHVKKTVVVREHVPWQDIPGYKILLKSFLVELKERGSSRMSEALKQATQSMLANEKLISVLVTIIYKQTRVYDSKAVINSFNTINFLFQCLIHDKKKIPTTFDYFFFFQGILRILQEQDHALCIAKCLWMLYNNFILFSAEFQKEISSFLLGEIFIKLFLHWSVNVRLLFHHLLFYRIFHLCRNSKSKNNDLNKTILEIYSNSNQKIQNQEKESFKNDLIYQKYQRAIQLMQHQYLKLKQQNKINRQISQVAISPVKSLKLKLQSKSSQTSSLQTSQIQDTLNDISISSRNQDQNLSVDQSNQNFQIQDQSMNSEVDYSIKKQKNIRFDRNILKMSLQINTQSHEFGSQSKTQDQKSDQPQFTDFNNLSLLDQNQMDESLLYQNIKSYRSEQIGELVANTNLNVDSNDRKPEQEKEKMVHSDELHNHASQIMEMQGGDEILEGQKNKQFVVNRIFKYHKSNDNLKEKDISKELLKYVLVSYKESEIVKKNYDSWYKDFYYKQKKKGEDHLLQSQYSYKLDQNYYHEVPEVTVQIPFDLTDQQTDENDEW